MVRTLALLLTLGVPGPAAAQVAATGATLATRTFEDQHGVLHALDESTRLLVFARDMDAGDRVKAAFADVTGEQLAERGIAYVSDISGMPKLVGRLFALPAMRKRAYPMWLDRDGAKTADLPSEAGRVTLLRLEQLQVTAVEIIDSPAALRASLRLGSDADQR